MLHIIVTLVILSAVKHSMTLHGKRQCHMENRMLLCNFDLLRIHYSPISYAIKGCINMEVQDR